MATDGKKETSSRALAGRHLYDRDEPSWLERAHTLHLDDVDQAVKSGRHTAPRVRDLVVDEITFLLPGQRGN